MVVLEAVRAAVAAECQGGGEVEPIVSLLLSPAYIATLAITHNYTLRHVSNAITQVRTIYQFS